MTLFDILGQAFWKTSGSIQSSDIENKSMQVPKSKKVKSKSSSESIGSKHTHISSIEDPFPRGSSQRFGCIVISYFVRN